MTRHRMKVIVASAVVTMTAAMIFLLSNLHWKLYGWTRGEPFLQGLPASYYASRTRNLFAGAAQLGAPRRISPAELWVRPRLPSTLANALWPAAPPFGEAMLIGPTEVIYVAGGDPLPSEALPVLIAMADDPNPRVRRWAVLCMTNDSGPAVPVLTRLLNDSEIQVRYFAMVELGQIGEAARSAIPNLRALVGDPSVVFPSEETAEEITIGRAAADALRKIERDSGGAQP